MNLLASTTINTQTLTYQDILLAAQRIQKYVCPTPLLDSSSANELLGCQCFFKCENLQKSGSFKFRGASNVLFSLNKQELSNGIVSHSSGNLGAAMAMAAMQHSLEAHIVVPEDINLAKQENCLRYGAHLSFCQPEQRDATARQISRTEQKTFIDPFNDARIIAGQGTVALEILRLQTQLDFLLIPIGSGGLAAASALLAKKLSPKTQVIGVEPEGADDALQSLLTGQITAKNKVNTIADGLRSTVGTTTFPLLQQHLSDIVTVREQSIKEAIKFVWQELKLVIEPSAAVTVAAIMEKKAFFHNSKVAVVLSGGNLSLQQLQTL